MPFSADGASTAVADHVTDDDECRSDELRRGDHLRQIRQSRRDDPLIGTCRSRSRLPESSASGRRRSIGRECLGVG